MIISGDRRISYPEIFARAAKAATGLKELGVAGGTPVAMMLRNDFAFFECSSAAATLGSPVVPINWHLKADEVNYILGDCGSGVLVCHADLWPQIRDGVGDHIKVLIVPTPPEIAAAFNVPPTLARAPDGMTDWEQWRRAGAVVRPDRADVADVLHFGHHGAAEGRAARADAARAACGG